jgi:putative endonuclease
LPFWVYILRSLNKERFYCGHTSDLQRRINQHNDPEYQLSRTTKVFQGPWKVVWTKECTNRSEAMKVEKSIKKRGIGRFLEAQLVESRRRRD